jgi:hypothetical protein
MIRDDETTFELDNVFVSELVEELSFGCQHGFHLNKIGQAAPPTTSTMPWQHPIPPQHHHALAYLRRRSITAQQLFNCHQFATPQCLAHCTKALDACMQYKDAVAGSTVLSAYPSADHTSQLKFFKRHNPRMLQHTA